MPLTIQIFHHGHWHDAAHLTIPEPEKGRAGPAQLGYEQDYAIEWMYRQDECACSLAHPVELMSNYQEPNWFYFLEDIMPAGAGRRYWVDKLGLAHLPESEQDHSLLQHGTIAPVGNLRIKESLPALPTDSKNHGLRFSVEDVVERHVDFLEYAQEMGAASGGATGAVGEAPKFLIRCSKNNQVWIDTFQEDLTNPDTHYLVKFPRGNRSQVDCDILRTEYYYYQALAKLGVDTIDISKMHLREGKEYPSLWLPRFDVEFINGELTHYGMESVYSVVQKPTGSYLNHFDVVTEIAQKLPECYQKTFVIEWLKRDFLNVVFANSDNHGRNASFIKRPGSITLAPVYDFAPMKADPEGVIRITKWGSPYEEGGNFNWHAIAENLDHLVERSTLIGELKLLASQLTGLKRKLTTQGAPESILSLPTLGMDYLDEKLRQWNLL